MLETLTYLKKYKYLLLIIFPALFIYLLVTFPSGSYYCIKEKCGYFFWGVHGRDAIWHLAIAETSFKRFPFLAPTYAGVNLYGYNWFMDFIIFLLTKLSILSLFTYFKLIPAVWFFLFTILSVKLARKIRNHPLFVGIFLFLSYFAGSFSYLLTLYHGGTIKNSSSLLPQPIIHAMSNLEYALSLLPLILLLIFIIEDKFNLKKAILSGILIFLLLGLKFYGGVIGVFMIFSYVILNLVQNLISKKKMLKQVQHDIGKLFIIFLFVLGSLLIFYNPLSAAKTGFPFSFSPFALVHPITEAPDQFYLRNLTDARYYLQQFGIGPRLIGIELLNLIIFLIFYFGTRFFGLVYIAVCFIKSLISFPRNRTTVPLGKSSFDLTALLTIFFSILLTVSLVQKGVWWNTIQFFFYGIFLSTLFLSELIFNLFKSKNKLLLLIGLIILIMSVPTSFDIINHYLKESKAVYLPRQEIEALSFLKRQQDGIVFSPLKKEPVIKEEPFPMGKYSDSGYISAFSGKQMYLAEIQSLSVTSVDFKDRLERMNKTDCSILDEVDYVYEVKDITKKSRILNKCKNKKVKKIFDNKSVKIYKIMRSS